MIAVGERIYVKDLLFEGHAIVKHIVPREIFGIQIELEQGDQDGHRIFRVSNEQVIKSTCYSPKQYEIGTSIVKTVNLKVGDQYILKTQSQYTLKTKIRKIVTHYYVYRLHDEKFLGSYEVSCFKNVKPYLGKHQEPQQEKPKEIQPMKFEQLSLF